MSVTIVSVARLAGVSKKTVSRVLNQEPHVSAAIRAKVLRAMTELDYTPNIAARRLASNSAFAIGFLFGGADGEYFPQIILSLVDLGTQIGYTVVVSHFLPFNEVSRAQTRDLVKRRAVDGLVMTPMCDNDTEMLKFLEDSGVPFVRISPFDPTLPLPYVTADDQQGARTMTAHLIGLGHRRIGFLAGHPHHHSSQARFRGYQAALRAHRHPALSPIVQSAEFRFDLGLEAATRLLELPSEKRPSAIFGANDESAAGALVAAHRLGIAVPGEVSVAGFDDFPSAAKTYPALTTMRQPVDEISRKATQLLIDILSGRNPEPLHIKVPTTLVVRESTGPAPPK